MDRSAIMATAWYLYNKYFRSEGRPFDRAKFGKSLGWAWERAKKDAATRAARDAKAAAAASFQAHLAAVAAKNAEPESQDVPDRFAGAAANVAQQIAQTGRIDINAIRNGAFRPRNVYQTRKAYAGRSNIY